MPIAFVIADRDAARAKQEPPRLATKGTAVGAPTLQARSGKVYTSVSLEERSTILEKEITTYANMGWRVTSRTATSAQLTRDNPPSWGTAILLALFFIIPAVLYLLFYKRTEDLYLQVNDQGEVIKSGASG